MTPEVVTAGGDASILQVAELMRAREVGSVVLVEDGRAVGFLTDRDLAVGVLAIGGAPAGRAGDIASAPVVCGSPGMGVEEAGELMAAHGIRRLPVEEDGRLAGIVTLDDLAVRTGDPALAQRLTSEVTRAALPGFFFHQRGG